MKIDRSNYEIWFIDWLDGNMDDIRVEQLLHFLDENPDLKEELNDLAIVRLNPYDISFSNKSHLKKTAADLSESQSEYLSVAYLENDLSSDQKEDLMEIIEKDPAKKKSFELMQKIRLTPMPLFYKHKNRLIRRTVVQNVIRLSLIGLSAAAIITLLVITYFSKPKSLQGKFKNTAQAIRVDSIIRKPAVEILSDHPKTEKKVVASKKQIKKQLAILRQVGSVPEEINMNLSVQDDSHEKSAGISGTLLEKISFSSQIDLKGQTNTSTLMVLNSTVAVPDEDDGRPKLSKIIAKAFREKILKEKKAKDSPLKIYEIAEAGVSGLNKLLGWQMALDKKNDEYGELKSVYFSSKILKFNAPVKKTETLQ
jgi:hypothetical protein